MSNITLPSLPAVHKPRSVRMAQQLQLIWLDDPWLIATIVVAMLASVVALLISCVNHWVLLYNDSYDHLDVARRVIDNVTPGLAQLGGVWLPLPHILMMPFIWNDTLWRSGLAGSIPSMIAFVIAASYLYRSALRLTSDARASFIGTLVFVLNPNVLYLQSTPLSESILMATMIAACYYFLVWSQNNQIRDLILAAIATFLATMARYDGWALFLSCFVMIAVIGWRQRQPMQQIQSNLIIYGALGCLGIILWFLWDQIIFGDPLYFQHSQYSAQSQQKILIQKHTDQAYHNLLQAIHDYVVVAVESLGPILFILAALAVVLFVRRRRLSVTTLAALVFLVPFAFYVISLYTGQAIIWAPHATSANAPVQWYNVRYGSQVVAPAGLFLATMIKRWPLGSWLMTLLIVIQSCFIMQGGIITVQDGQFGSSCSIYSIIPQYLAQHYSGGYILQDTYDTRQNIASAGIDLKDIVYEGSGQLWKAALADPSQFVKWIILKESDLQSPADMVAQHIDISSANFQANFTFEIADPNTRAMLFRRNDNSARVTRATVPSSVEDTKLLCGSTGH